MSLLYNPSLHLPRVHQQTVSVGSSFLRFDDVRLCVRAVESIDQIKVSGRARALREQGSMDFRKREPVSFMSATTPQKSMHFGGHVVGQRNPHSTDVLVIFDSS